MNTSLEQSNQSVPRSASSPTWLAELRDAAAGRFHATGFPKQTEEAWRFINLSGVTSAAFVPAPPAEPEQVRELIAKFGFGDEALVELVFVNGRFEPGLSRLPRAERGVTVSSLRQAVASHPELVEPALGRFADIEANPFVALNTGAIDDGAFIHLSRGTVLEGVVHLLFLSTRPAADRTVSHPRTLVIAEDNSEAAVVETYAGAGGEYLTNAVTEIVCGADARIDHNKLNHESVEASHVATMQVNLGRGAQFVSHSITIGGKLTRNDLNCKMAGEGAYATLNGLVLIGGTQHCDNHTLLDHAEPNCPSHELYKHVLNGRASAVFKGQILVRKIAQKTDSKQNSRTLLLSDDATMNSMPALEIYADDVKCTHGSTIGPVDDEMVFYIQSRGVSLEAARHLLTYAFAADVTRRIRVEPVRRRIEDFMAAQHGLPLDLRINDLGAFDDDLL